MTEWINVKDGLPIDTQLVLTYDKTSVWCSIYSCDTDRFESLESDLDGESWEIKNVTHWMHLPHPPEKDND